MSNGLETPGLHLQLSVVLRDLGYLSAGINVVHLVALVVLLGALAVVDLRLIGGALTGEPLARVAAHAESWFVGGLAILAITGVPQLTASALKQYHSAFFWWKTTFLIVALTFTATVRRTITRREEAAVPQRVRTVVGIVSLALWVNVAICGRLIGLL